MFYKIRNLLLILAAYVLASCPAIVKAQGVVSLSEEAMFDDELETNNDFPELETSKKESAPAKPETAPKEADAANTPDIAPVPAPAPAPTAAPAPAPFSIPAVTQKTPAPEVKSNLFGNSQDIAPVSNDLFEQMSDLEKRTALMNLELKRERLQNEIDAVKNQRQQAVIQEQEKAEQQRLKSIEFEKEQERKVLLEQEKLRELDIKFETLRQEKLLNSYKNQMLEENQRWIEHNADFYKQIADLRQSKKDMAEETKNKLEAVQKEALAAKITHQAKIEGFKREIRDQQAQIGVLRNRIETLEQEREEARRNPFADPETAAAITAAGFVQASATGLTSAATDVAPGDASATEEPVETDLSKLYAVTEIRGQGGELIAKLINKNGTSFYVKKGTVLQSGHTIGDITLTYVTAEQGSDKKYLYFAAGGVLPTETSGLDVKKEVSDSNNSRGNTSAGLISTNL